ncbi:MAG: tetratricopeptide repeat protein [Anaerolineae bacterium]
MSSDPTPDSKPSGLSWYGGLLVLLLVAATARACEEIQRPNDVVTRLMLEAEAFVKAGAYSAAEEAYQDAASQASEDPAPTLALVDLYLLWSRADAGLEAVEAAKGRGASSQDTVPRRLRLLLSAGRWSEVTEVAEAGLAASTVEPGEAHAALLRAHLQQHACLDAQRDAQRLARARPLDTGPARTLALLTGDSAALEKLDPALVAGLEGCSPACDLPIAQRLIRADEWGLAACLLARSVATAPSAEAHLWLGEALARIGKISAAEDHFLTAVEQMPDSALAWLLLGKYELSKGNLERGRVALLNAQRLDPLNPAPCLGVAELKAEAGKYDEADRWIGAALDRSGRDPEVWKAAARFYLSRDLVENKRVIEMAQEAVDLAPEDAEAYMLLGWAYLAVGRPMEAAAALTTAADLDPTSAEAHYHHARALHALGREDAAEQALTRARDLDYALAGRP